MRRLPAAFAILSAALLLALGACRQEPAAPATADAGAPVGPAPAAESAPVAAPSPDPATTVATAPAATGAPTAAAIASAEGEKPGIRVEVTELKRGSGDTVSLKFAVINDSDESLSVTSNYLGDTGISNDYATVGGIHLVDAVGKRKYMVVRDSERNCVCSSSVKEIPARSRVNLWAKYPAPPAGTTMVSIVVPHFSPMDDVTIQ